MKKRDIPSDPISQEKVLDKTYVSRMDLQILYPTFGYDAISRQFKKIQQELLSEGKGLMPGRPETVPLRRVLKVWPLEQASIRKAAKRMREYS